MSTKKTDPTGLQGNLEKHNTLDALLNRAIRFRKSRYVDDKLERFKTKFAPVNGATRVLSSSTQEPAESLESVDANGFELPTKTLFSEKWLNTQWETIRPMGAGLTDELGKATGLNCILQILTYTPALANYLTSHRHSNNCVVQDTCFMCALEGHVHQCFRDKQNTVAPRYFVGRLKSMPGGRTNDTVKIFDYFMQQMQHHLLLEKGAKEPRRNQETTALYQIFGGYLLDNFVCQECNQPTNTFEPFLRLTADVTAGNTLERCLSPDFRERSATLTCERCSLERPGKAKRSLYRTPRVLAIHLDRFDASGSKNDKKVKFEDTFSVERFTHPDEKKKTYDLYGVIVHEGNRAAGGRFVAYIKGPNGLWHRADKEAIHQVSADRVYEQKAYMLFYTLPPDAAPRSQPKAGLKPRKEKEEAMVEEIKAAPNEDDEEEEEEEEIEEQEDIEEKERREEAERFAQAKEAAAAQPVLENETAVTVRHDESMESKRGKLELLIEREREQGRSAEVKDQLLKSNAGQFYGEVGTWDDDQDMGVQTERQKVLKQLKGKRKKKDVYDVDYDRGKVKKVKNKNHDRFERPNMFQVAVDAKRLDKEAKQKQKQNKKPSKKNP
ncbi:hypothetical protein BCR43DRAFT_455940 [Syncephalastrum racemosum]|uniref:ubiquitinyl hydrolase 1 n=1 Tax=Syncephalastrum racemosum TaxID=13706 RepID=A0A1X2HK14_SYNRA|nr:hypothetical protein BCR43DRAFT_455940 [Syncephalastrum racemosum]